MALQTKTMTKSGPRGYALVLVLEETSVDVSSNTSLIDYTLKLTSGNYSYSQFSTGWEVWINGRVNYQNRSDGIKTGIAKNSTLILCSGQVTVDHLTDGTKTINTIYATLDIGGDPAPGAISIDQDSWTLTTIPRASSVDLSNGTLDTSQNITITPHVSSYKHKLTYSCGSATGSIASGISGSTSGFTQSWTPPLSLAAQNTTGTTVSVTVICETYNGSVSAANLVGTSSKVVTMTIPASVAPSVTAIGITEISGQTHMDVFGAYVQNKSRVNISLTVNTAQGAAISSYSIKIGTKQTFSTNGVANVRLTESGDSIAIKATVVDTRGRSGTRTVNIRVMPYTAPEITAISIIRSDFGGTASTSGEYATVIFSSQVSPLNNGSTNKNTATYTLKYKTRSDTTYSTMSLPPEYSGNYHVTNGKGTFSANPANAHDAYIVITDAFGSVNSLVVHVQSAEVFFKADPEHNSFSFGKLETISNTLGSAWNVDVTRSSGDAYTDVSNAVASIGMHVLSDGTRGIYDNTEDEWLIGKDANGVTHIPNYIPDYLLPTAGSSNAAVTLPTDSGNVTYLSYNQDTRTPTVTIPTGTPIGWCAIVLKVVANGNMLLVASGDDQLYVHGQSGLMSNVTVDGGYSSAMLIRTSNTRIAVIVDTMSSGGGDTVAWGDITGKPAFADVATSGDYNDLLNQPTIPAQGQMWFSTSSTAQGTVKKTTSITGFPATLTNGLLVAVRFSNANTSTSPTLSINSGTAVGIRRYGSTVAGTSAALSWQAGTVVLMCYYKSPSDDNGYWYIINWQNTTYSAMTEAEVDAGTGTTSRIITPARLKYAVQTWEHVNSVNGQTGAVSLTIPTVPTDVSAFNNDAGYLTLSDLPIWDGSVT